MKFLNKSKDGGPNSPVEAFFICEIKSLFTIAILKFNKGGREAFHTHAFNAYTWFLSGNLIEEDFDGSTYHYKKSILPKKTPYYKNHRVKALFDSYCLTFRGPWKSTWSEHYNATCTKTTLTHGRRIVSQEQY